MILFDLETDNIMMLLLGLNKNKNKSWPSAS
jgi:hypothetical protein